MKRVLVLCEGQTEERFVNSVLGPYFAPQSIYLSPIVLSTRRIASGGKYRGGVSSYEKISRELKLLCRDKEAYVTSLLDYFALPEDTPQLREPGFDLYSHVSRIERAVDRDVGCPNCHTNLLIHEFEGLLFSDPEAFALIADEDAVQALRDIRSAFQTPEEINSSFETAPSKRILSCIPRYKKVTDGGVLSRQIGVNRMMEECPHFNAWMQKILSSRRL